ncbi:RluA family pseudouridine synthase [Hydrogenophaga sp. 5NK40-0174]|uniref:RluA family pseudouridine synthase n=1 Tax=Hydrogenophaga sp. 5NK40-0174 TaxID=3127649 RepID=UPI00333E26E8
MRTFTLDSKCHGLRLDKVMAQLVPDVSRSYLQQLVQDGAVTLDGAPAGKQAAKVRAMQVLSVELRPTEQARAFVPEPMDIDVAYEDEHFMVVRKPAGLVVHPGAGNWTGTLLNGLLGRDAVAAGLPRAGIVHRLDKDTSGLMLVGRSRQGMDGLTAAIAERRVKRQYLALALGVWRGMSVLEVDEPIGRDSRNRLRMAVIPPESTYGKPARTTISRLDSNEMASLVACQLHTGRTHQIRVHMAHIGLPLVGDALYGGAVRWGMRRQALHAVRLALVHPVTGESMCFDWEPPGDFVHAVQEAGLHYNGVNMLES